MATDASSSMFPPWPDRLRHSAIILLAAGLALAALVLFGKVSPATAAMVFVCVAGAALVPWQLHNAVASRDEVLGISPVEALAVSAVVAGMLLFRLLYYYAPFLVSVILLTLRELILGARLKRLRKLMPAAESESRRDGPYLRKQGDSGA